MLKGYNKETTQHVNSQLDHMLSNIVFRRIKSPNETAIAVFKLYECALQFIDWKTPEELHRQLKLIGETLVSKDRMNFVVRNCSERMLKLLKKVCDEKKISIFSDHFPRYYIDSLKQLSFAKGPSSKDDLDIIAEQPNSPLLQKCMTMTNKTQKLMDDDVRIEIQEDLIDKVREALEEIEISRENVTNQAKEHINDNDLILTYSTSETLLQFFKEASKTVKFELIVLETAPTYEGHKTARQLAEAGIQVNLVQDSAVFAVMSRVDKVIISTHGIMANGGVIGQSGVLMIAHAAQANQVPLFVLGSVYKLTPLHPIDCLTYNEFLQPSRIFREQADDCLENIEVVVPAYDYVPPKMVSLILTNQEGYTPENIYRAFHELYGKQGTHEIE